MGIIPKVVIAAIFIFMAVLECSGVQIKIISFNIENFGKRQKLYDSYEERDESDLAEGLVNILKNYDIIFIQEIKGSRNRGAVTDIKDILNKSPAGENSANKYEVVWPGCFFDSTGNWETYAYYINTYKIKKWKAHLYPSWTLMQSRDGFSHLCENDKRLPENENSGKYFVRPPYSLCVSDNADKTCLFFLLGLHAKPLARPDRRSSRRHLRTTKQELDNLKTAYDYFSHLYETNDAILMGDLNADRPYLNPTQFQDLQLTKSNPDSWISYSSGRQQYTNVAGDSMVHRATYDRFYCTTDDMLKCVNHKAEVVNDPVIRMISDHYPIAITIDCDKFNLDGSGGAAACPLTG